VYVTTVRCFAGSDCARGPAVLTSRPSWPPRAVAAAISAGCTAELYEPAQQKEYAERDGEDVPAAQTVMDCVKGIGHDDEQPDED
jgi:hypothetical protein